MKALEQAQRGDFSRVTIAGHVWIRDGVDKAAAWDAIIIARELEREKCAELLEAAYVECETLNLLHGAARIRARSFPSPQATVFDAQKEG